MSAEVVIEAQGWTLGELEEVVEKGLHSFLDAGRALWQIREQRLYRTEYSTWEAYCRLRWQFTDRRARQLIDAAELVDRLIRAGQEGTLVPTTEWQCRHLGLLPPALQELAWERLLRDAGGEQPAGPDVTALVGQILAGMTPEQQAAVLADDGARARPGLPPGTRAVNWPRRLTAAERLLTRLELEHPEAVRRVGAERLADAAAVLEELAAALGGAGAA